MVLTIIVSFWIIKFTSYFASCVYINYVDLLRHVVDHFCSCLIYPIFCHLGEYTKSYYSFFFVQQKKPAFESLQFGKEVINVDVGEWLVPPLDPQQ